MKLRHCSGTSSSGKIASTGHGSTHAPQSMHSSGSMKYMSEASSLWMQSTGQTSTQEASFRPTQGWVMTYAMAVPILSGGLGGTLLEPVAVAGHGDQHPTPMGALAELGPQP